MSERPAGEERSGESPRGLGRVMLALAGALLAGALLLPLTLAARHGALHFIVGGAGGLLLAAGLCVAGLRPARRRAAWGLLTAGLAIGLPLVLPIPTARRGSGPIVSRSVFGGDGGTPWFSLIPEGEVVRVGEEMGWGPHELGTVQRSGWMWQQYGAIDERGLFVRTESLVLDSWLHDRGHYWLAVPDGARGETGAKVPLILFLHGAGGNFRAFAHWLVPPALERGFACAFPTWGMGDWPLERLARRLCEVIDHAATEAPVDRERVLLCGLSAGAMAAGRMQQRHPDRFAAVALISGAPSIAADAATCRRAPWWLAHGDADGHVPVGFSRGFAASLRAASARVELIEYPGDDHALLLVRHDEVLGRMLDWAEPHLAER